MKITKDKIIELIIENQVDIIKSNNMTPDSLTLSNFNFVEDYMELLNIKIEMLLNSSDFVFDISYQEKFKILLFTIEYQDTKDIYSIQMNEIERYISSKYGNI